MAERTGRTAAKQPLTPTLWILLVVVLVVLVGGGLYMVLSLLGDEPPIRVRNGSMEVVLKNGEWQEDVDAWFPSQDQVLSEFTVMVENSAGSSCKDGQTGSGQKVLVSYTDGTIVSFMQAGSSGKIIVQPKDALRKAGPRLLEHGQANDKDYITAVEVLGGGRPWTCEFGSDGALRVIKIDLK
jgi:hypothetical protein